MKYVGSVLFLSALLVFGLVFMGMAVWGLIRGRVYHTAGRPPIVFREEPTKFVVWTLCLIIMSLGCLAGAAVVVGRMLKEM